MAQKQKASPPYTLRFAVALASLLALSCSLFEKAPALLWTDTPEILIAVEMFNASQDRRLIEVRYEEDLHASLSALPEKSTLSPSLVLGQGLRTQALSDYFQSMEFLFGPLALSKEAFYPSLLEGGAMNKRQALVPVSFNILLVLMSKDVTTQDSIDGMADLDVPPVDAAAITMEEMQRRTSLFAAASKEGDKRIGFSPRWPDEDFLFQWVQMSGASFRENGLNRERKSPNGASIPLSWNPEGLEAAVASHRTYISSMNGSAAAEDAYAFKYLFAPGYKNVETGKILFAAIKSADFFTLPPVLRARFDYRYFSEKRRLALSEGIRYAGIPKKAPNKATARKFLKWFFNAENQKAVLEKSRTLRLSESAFGIAGGFSALQDVTETIMPGYYTDLIGHIPPKEMVLPPEPMPPRWPVLKKEFLIPWLDDAASQSLEAPIGTAFASSLEAFLDKNPDLR
ncbi:MAG: hypothetical protein Q8O15_00960 [Rectinemataceae bacterium]|nr:hypothetical protein [Rectinemataceae bacterium]